MTMGRRPAVIFRMPVEVAIAPSANAAPAHVPRASSGARDHHAAIHRGSSSRRGPRAESRRVDSRAAGRRRAALGDAGPGRELRRVIVFGYLSGDISTVHAALRTRARRLTAARVASIQAERSTPHVDIFFQGFAAILPARQLQRWRHLQRGTLLYLLSCGAALELTRRDVRTDGAPFTVPLPWLWPIAGATVIFWILSTATSTELTVTALVLAAATALYYVTRRRVGVSPTRLQKHQ